MVHVDCPETGKCLVDEYEANYGREYLLSEPREQFHNSTSVERNQTDHYYRGPKSNPESEIEEWDIVRGTKVEDNLFKYDCWTSGPEDHQWLTREDAKYKIANPNSQNHLHGTLER